MVYRAIGVMSGSSLDGLDLAFVEFEENAGRWSFEILEADCLPYSQEWSERLRNAIHLSAKDYMLLHAEYGHYIGKQVVQFMQAHEMQYQVALVSSHGHTSFHIPPLMTGQLGDGAAIAAETGLPVVTELRAVDVALGGQGAPIVPMGERLLWRDHDFFLNLGGIANLSVNKPDGYLAYDVCPANRVLNMLAGLRFQSYDKGGTMAASGKVLPELLDTLDGLPYYAQPYPKSLANDFGTDVVFPILEGSGASAEDLLCTFTEHVALQVADAVEHHLADLANPAPQLLVTGGGAFNEHMVSRLRAHLEPMRVQLVVPDPVIINYKEAMIMALLGILRWREEVTVLSSVTGASRDSIGGALWLTL